MGSAMVHQNREQLVAFALGQVDEAIAQTIAEHLETCTECREIAIGAPPDDFLNRVREAASVEFSDDTISSDLAGQQDYEILREIGRGGMGVVYLVRNRRMDRLEALKVVQRSLVERGAALDRFQREIRAAARLNHPHIVTAFNAPRWGGSLALAMEYIPGEDLHQTVQMNGPLSVAGACLCAYQAALALQHAHERGLVHRDIKPSNLMLSADGARPMVKVMDFGLAKAASESSEFEELTTQGEMLGSLHYVAPEQASDAASANICADIYSLGCTLYYLLAGRPPFQAKSAYELLKAHEQQTPTPLDAVRSDVPSDLAMVVSKMLAKTPAKRYQTPAELARVLVPFFKPGQSVAPPAQADTAHGIGAATPAPPVTPAPFPIPLSAPSPVAIAAPMPIPIVAPVEQVGISIETRGGAVMSHGGRSSLLPGRQRAMLAAAAAAALLGIIFLVRTPNGIIKIELSAPKASVGVTIDQNHIEVAGLDEPLFLDVGEHELIVKGDGYETVTKHFKVTSGKNSPLTIALVPRENGSHDEQPGDTAQQQAATLSDSVAGQAPRAVAPFDAKQARAHQEAWAMRLGTRVEIENSVGMKLRLIPPGEFLMGSSRQEIDALVKSETHADRHAPLRSEGPQHRVQLTKAYHFGSSEVTQSQYRQVIGSERSFYSSAGERAGAVKDLETDQLPVENVSWLEAIEFCNKLSKREKLPLYYARDGETITVVGGTGYRLPTEAEWEYACRAGTTTRWFFGDNKLNLAKYAWIESNADGRTHRCEELPANAFGLHDMHGNVHEWCWDWYSDDYSAAALNEPRGPSAGSLHVFRGGACIGCAPYFSRSASRQAWWPPTRGWGNVGFRVARNAEGSDCPVAPASDPQGHDADRRAAEYVLSVGGKVRVNGQLDGKGKWQGDGKEITKVGDLPDGVFGLTCINLADSRGVTEAGLKAIQGTKHLQMVIINRCPGISDASFACFKDNRQLKSLGLWHTKISAEGLRHFKDCTELQWLHLGGRQDFGNEDMAFFTEFSGLRSLGMLWLHETSVSDAGLVNLIGADNLGQLNLDGTKITDEGLRFVANHQKLTWLTLPDTAIGDAGLAWLRKCHGLRGLNLKRTKVTAEGVKTLKRALPQCEISWDGGAVTLGASNSAAGETKPIIVPPQAAKVEPAKGL